MRILKSKVFVKASLAKAPDWLWSTTDGDYTYHNFVQFCKVNGRRITGIQLVVGPLVIGVAWPRKVTK